MPRYKVTVLETTSIYRAEYFDAQNEDDARMQAEETDWRDWEEVYSAAQCAIEEVDELPEEK